MKTFFESKNQYFYASQPKDKSEIPYVDAKFVRTDKTGDKVYFLEEGNAHWIKNPETLRALGGDFGKVLTMEFSVFNKFNLSEPITLDTVKEYISKENKKEKEDIEEKKVETIPLTTFKPEEEEVLSAPKEEPEKGFTSIIIPAYFNGYPIFHYTGNCIGSIQEYTDKLLTPYEIILVINGETGIKFDNLDQTYCDKVVSSKENEGYAKAVNRGIRVAKGEYIAIVNNDVQVFDHWLEDFQDCLNYTDLIMATPMYGMPFARAVKSREMREKWLKKSPQDSFSEFRDFSCICTRKSLFKEIGVFDEQFFAYKEDLDLLNRMDKVGKKYSSTKLVNTFHIIGATSSNMSEEDLKKQEGTEYYKNKYAV